MNADLNTLSPSDPILSGLTAGLFRFTTYQDMMRAVDRLRVAGIETYHINSDLSLSVWL